MKTSRGGGTAPPAAPWTASSARIDTAACSADAVQMQVYAVYLQRLCSAAAAVCLPGRAKLHICTLHVHARGRLLRGAEVRVVRGEGGAVRLAKAEEGQVAARGLASHRPYSRGRQRLLEHL